MFAFRQPPTKTKNIKNKKQKNMSSSIAATRRGKRAKHHDKDKYYRLAKEQGYRSRAGETVPASLLQ